MIKIEAYKNNNFHAEIKQLSIKRNWMDDTWNSHAYHCFPINLCNQMAWGISFPEDISFIWDGISDSSTEHIKIISGHRYVSLARGNATVSFNTGVRLTTDKNTSILQIPVPNDFNLDYLSFSSIISTSFFEIGRAHV